MAETTNPAPQDPGGRLATQSIFFYGPVMVAVMIWDVYQGSKLFRQELWAANRVLQDLGLGLAAGLGIVLLTWIAEKLFPWMAALENSFRRILGRPYLTDIAMIAMLSSAAEELFFRGLLQHYTGLVPASIIFGLFHFPAEKSLIPWTIFALVVGFGLGFLYEFTGNISTVILTHFVINLINLYRITRKDRQNSPLR